MQYMSCWTRGATPEYRVQEGGRCSELIGFPCQCQWAMQHDVYHVLAVLYADTRRRHIDDACMQASWKKKKCLCRADSEQCTGLLVSCRTLRHSTMPVVMDIKRAIPLQAFMPFVLLLTTSIEVSQCRKSPGHHEAARAGSQLVHGWDCISCSTNSMLAGNFGHTNSMVFNMSDQWWIKEVATHYAAVALNDFLGSESYNGTGESGVVTVARALKAANPRIKVLWYQAADFVSFTPFIADQLMNHTDWWQKDDYGNVVWFRPPTPGRPGHPYLDLSVPEAQEWFANIPLSYFKDKEDAKAVCDGIFVDGASYRDFNGNISAARYQKLFDGKMKSLHLAQTIFTELNGGEVWGNAAMEAHPPSNLPAGITWNTTLQNFNGGFDEMFGSFSSQNEDGSWNTAVMEHGFETIINASNAGHTAVIHAFPGPATTPFVNRGPPGNTFRIASWKGAVEVPQTAEACRDAATKRLVESLAPFLIVANEHVFLSYAWFYSIEDGYIPCKPGVECGMPSEWYPEFTRPLGPPKGPAQRRGTVWTRQFEHASVYVDLSDRSASRITWS